MSQFSSGKKKKGKCGQLTILILFSFNVILASTETENFVDNLMINIFKEICTLAHITNERN